MRINIKFLNLLCIIALMFILAGCSKKNRVLSDEILKHDIITTETGIVIDQSSNSSESLTVQETTKEESKNIKIEMEYDKDKKEYVEVVIYNGGSSNNNQIEENNETNKAEENPWESPDAKQPKDYTWIEFQNLTTSQKSAFAESFDSNEEFQNWLDAKYEEMQSGRLDDELDENVTIKTPWENGGKLPDAYTWSEYESLTPSQREAFYDWFKSPNAFEKWMDTAQNL